MSRKIEPADDTPVARLRELAAKDCTECGGCDPIHPYCQRAGGGAPVSTAPHMINPLKRDPDPEIAEAMRVNKPEGYVLMTYEAWELEGRTHRNVVAEAEKRAVQAESQAAQLADTWNEVAVKMDARAEQAERARDELLEALKGFKTVVSPWIRRPPTVTFKQWEAAVERIDAALVRARPA